MIKNFFNGVIGGFSRTLGRILFYIFVALIFYFIFGLKNVDALEQTGTFQMTTPYDSPCGSGATGYCAIQMNQSVYTRSLNTTYNGVLQCINFEVNYTFNSNYQYNLYLEGMSSDFRNNSLTHYVYGYHNSPSQVDSISTTLKFISKNKLQISFPKGIFYAHYPVTICGNPLTGISNYGIKKAYLKYDDGQQDIGGVIENNNTNTQNIIENNNSNTEDIKNTIDKNLNDCRSSVNLWNLSTMVTNSSGVTTTPTGFIYYRGSETGGKYIYNLIHVDSGKPYTMSFKGGASNTPIIIYYDSLYGNILAQSSTGSLTFTSSTSRNIYATIIINSTATSFAATDIMFYQGSSSIPYEPYGEEICSNKLDDINGGLSDINSSLTSQTPMDSSIFSTWWTNFTQNQFSNPLGNLITLPVNLVQKLINYSESACSPVQLGSLLGTNLTLSCFTLGDIITNSTVLNVIDLIMSLSLIVFTLKKAYETVSNLISLGGENEVKKHFKFPTPMEFIASLFGGGK